MSGGDDEWVSENDMREENAERRGVITRVKIKLKEVWKANEIKDKGLVQGRPYHLGSHFQK